MPKVNAFDVLKQMCDDNCQSFKLFGGSNLKSAVSGKQWGSVTIAVDNQTVLDILNNENKIVFKLLVYSFNDYKAAEQKLLSEVKDNPMCTCIDDIDKAEGTK